MDFWPGLGANHSNSSAIARICNDIMGKKTRFYVPDSAQHHTSGGGCCIGHVGIPWKMSGGYRDGWQVSGGLIRL
ncbi:MAG: hypothetical protein ABI410_01085, partial [Rhodoferax sp.]|uniref:hypothetical protein n=1 Tax=Rhodoferax sp. TaxID=50421 RepID=UPI0032661C53